MKAFWCALTLLVCMVGCGGSQEPIKPDNPEPPPADGPSEMEGKARTLPGN